MERNDMPQDGREHGFAICNANGRLLRGPESVGHRYGVKVDVTCPRGSRAVGIFHTHPGGVVEPSPADIREARRFGVPYVCQGVPETGQIGCRLVRRRR